MTDRETNGDLIPLNLSESFRRLTKSRTMILSRATQGQTESKRVSSQLGPFVVSGSNALAYRGRILRFREKPQRHHSRQYQSSRLVSLFLLHAQNHRIVNGPSGDKSTELASPLSSIRLKTLHRVLKSTANHPAHSSVIVLSSRCTVVGRVRSFLKSRYWQGTEESSPVRSGLRKKSSI